MNWEQLSQYINWPELIASILGVISVWFTVKRNIWTFPIGIVMVLMYMVIFYEAKFYSDMLLQAIYVIMQVQGWYEWSRGDRASDEKIAVQSFAKQQWLISGVGQVAGTLGLGYVMHRFTDAVLPWVDAFTTTMSLLAQWWMNKKYLQNWVLWIVVDVIYLYQYSAKALYLTTVLYGIFLLMAIAGYREWKQKAALPVAP